MIAHHSPAAERMVDVSSVEGFDKLTVDQQLEHVFFKGQNDFQPIPRMCSVSCGDVAELDGKKYLCAPTGWEEMTDEEFSHYLSLSKEEQWKFRFKIEDRPKPAEAVKGGAA